jgi:hypothetical protein
MIKAMEKKQVEQRGNKWDTFKKILTYILYALLFFIIGSIIAIIVMNQLN